MSVKGSRWSPEVLAHLAYLRRREWRASFADPDEALHYAWTHAGAFVVGHSVFTWKEAPSP